MRKNLVEKNKNKEKIKEKIMYDERKFNENKSIKLKKEKKEEKSI